MLDKSAGIAGVGGQSFFVGLLRGGGVQGCMGNSAGWGGGMRNRGGSTPWWHRTRKHSFCAGKKIQIVNRCPSETGKGWGGRTPNLFFLGDSGNCLDHCFAWPVGKGNYQDSKSNSPRTVRESL